MLSMKYAIQNLHLRAMNSRWVRKMSLHINSNAQKHRLAILGSNWRAWLALSCALIILPVEAATVTKPTEAQIAQVFNQYYGQKLMFFKPVEVPQEVERIHKSLVAELDQWVKLDLLTRKNSRFLAEKMMYGEPRMVSVGGFQYDLNPDNPWVSQQGFFYGRPKLKEVFTVSPPSEIAAEIVCEVYLSWYVVDQPDWINKIDIKQYRLLKRASESFKRPFEKRIYLVFTENRWKLWTTKGEQKLF